ncbi:TadA family conjugal transfer-associated ATPase [Winkia neuii]|uniref:TadA family conjugal transfer-associated ATPase n=1 Tax=Winkia neuii subsp. anitrata TaxID=29318 RepID=A0AB38XNZ5_9ACTO|nr:TadA family conjugal transfer-associated ATPase [Winkia neuii]WCE46000.1 TadA family conjugal transfer-associated ATPase [Winkia neuii subsp. anitrata]
MVQSNLLRKLVASGRPLPAAVAAVSQDAPVADELLARYRQAQALQGGLTPELEGLLSQEDVTDVLINGPESVWVDRGRGLQRARMYLGDGAQLRELAVRMAAACGQRLDDAAPILDGVLPSGTRVNALLPPLADQVTISLRTFRRHSFSLAELVDSGTVNAELASILAQAVQAKVSGLIIGGTGTGKTTLLSALLGQVNHSERIVCIEEVGELRPRHPHVVHLTERKPNVEGVGGISLSALLRASLRMRPDRVVVGECRGEEVREMMSALNTGHEGGWATLHANGVREVPARLLALGAMASMSEAAVAAQAAAAFGAVIHLSRNRGSRWVSEIGVPHYDGGRLQVQRVLYVPTPGAELIREGQLPWQESETYM